MNEANAVLNNDDSMSTYLACLLAAPIKPIAVSSKHSSKIIGVLTPHDADGIYKYLVFIFSFSPKGKTEYLSYCSY